MKVDLVADPAALSALCARIETAPRIGLDTEFHTEKHFTPKLMVVQVAFDDAVAIVDPLALADLSPLAEALTRATGGSDYPFLKERGIEDAIQKLGAEVHSQYILSFPQRDKAPGLHQIQVSVQGRGDLKIRARTSYWAE